jgi:uncharacterized membrane protein YfbV (UPF0208 family)
MQNAKGKHYACIQIREILHLEFCILNYRAVPVAVAPVAAVPVAVVPIWIVVGPVLTPPVVTAAVALPVLPLSGACWIVSRSTSDRL